MKGQSVYRRVAPFVAPCLTEGVDDTNGNVKTIHPLPPAGYSPLSQGESQLLPTKWPHRQYIILPLIQGRAGEGSVTPSYRGARGEGLGDSKLLLANATQDGTTQCDAIFIFCMHLRRVGGVYSVYSLQSVFIVHPRFIPQLSGTP